MGLNVKVNDKARTLTITLPMEPAGTRSASGKSEVVASTRGNQKVDIGGEEVSVGVNVYKR